MLLATPADPTPQALLEGPSRADSGLSAEGPAPFSRGPEETGSPEDEGKGTALVPEPQRIAPRPSPQPALGSLSKWDRHAVGCPELGSLPTAHTAQAM